MPDESEIDKLDEAWDMIQKSMNELVNFMRLPEEFLGDLTKINERRYRSLDEPFEPAW